MLPYYLLMELPEEDRLSFLLMQPFTPLSRPNMSAFVVAKSGPLEEYGEIIEYAMPRDRQIDGPGQVGDFIDQDPVASAEFTLLGQEGSEVIRGNMLVVPIEDSLLYVQPIYLAADTGGTGIPQFKRVVASFNSRIEIGESLDEVLIELFGTPGRTAPTEARTEAPTAGMVERRNRQRVASKSRWPSSSNAPRSSSPRPMLRSARATSGSIRNASRRRHASSPRPTGSSSTPRGRHPRASQPSSRASRSAGRVVRYLHPVASIRSLNASIMASIGSTMDWIPVQ